MYRTRCRGLRQERAGISTDGSTSPGYPLGYLFVLGLGFKLANGSIEGRGRGLFDIRFTRTLLATGMTTSSALRSLRSRKQRLASVTKPSNPLSSRSTDQILAARVRRESDFCMPGFAVRQDQRRVRVDSVLGPPVSRTPGSGGTSSRSRSRNSHGRRIGLALREWVTRAFLAPDVLAVDAESIRAKGRLAPVAGTTDSHADWLAHALNSHITGGFPFAWFEGETVLGE